MPTDTNQNPDWESFYQQKNTGWDRGKTSPNLLEWIENKDLTPCRILIPGCGNGYEVLTLASQGFEVVCVDIAPSAVTNLNQALKRNQLTAEVIESDFFSLDFTSKPFDAIYEQTCLCALQPSERQQFEQWLLASLKSAGKLYTHFMQTHQDGGPPFHCDMGEMQQLFEKSHWKWLKEKERQSLPSSSGKAEIPWLLEKISLKE